MSSAQYLAGGSGLQGKVLLGHKERFFFQKGKVPSFFWKKGKVLFGRILEKGKVLFCKRKGSFRKKERFFLEKGKVLFAKRKGSFGSS